MAIKKQKKPWIGYCGSIAQNTYGEDLKHGYLLWDIKSDNDFDVEFKELPNPKPYVTIDWTGNVSSTVDLAKSYPTGCRIRIRTYQHISHNDVLKLTDALYTSCSASEVTFKNDFAAVQQGSVTAGDVVVAREDLRNPDVLMGLLKDFYVDHNVATRDYSEIRELLKSYLTHCTDDDVARNVKWSLKDIKWDNLFSYGQENVIKFDALNGIVGVFGNNRIGKSSIPGVLMYTLFNGTDRGSVKNEFVCNVRKPYCYARAIINVAGNDYVIERSTTKTERNDHTYTSTYLNLFRVVDDKVIDLCGDGRVDTDKELKKLIGAGQDFLLTSFAAQGDMNQFVNQGSSKRFQFLSKFLDLEFFKKLYDLANADFNASKSYLKKFPERDWNADDEKLVAQLTQLNESLVNLEAKKTELSTRLEETRTSLGAAGSVVTESQIKQQKDLVESLKETSTKLSNQIDEKRNALHFLTKKRELIVKFREKYDIIELKKKMGVIRNLVSSVQSARHAYEKERDLLKSQKKSLKILNEVPCGDSFPDCKFIRDAYLIKEKIESQENKVVDHEETLKRIQSTLVELDDPKIAALVDKLERLTLTETQHIVEASTITLALSKLEASQIDVIKRFDIAKQKLRDLQEAYDTEASAEHVAAKNSINALINEISLLEKETIRLAHDRGRLESELALLRSEKGKRADALRKLKIHELVARAFSKQGIPNLIVASQLPVINGEIFKILNGVVDFKIELERDEDDIEIYIDYGDSRRPIELGSGMEKLMASIAIRVALIKVSVLPKTDMLILDEGFDVLDQAGVEICNRLLVSLKEIFSKILVITHLDGLKDCADVIIEISKVEKDSRVVFEEA